jgi:hypothetical protein
MTELDEFIKMAVNDKGPIKGVDLALEVVKHNHGMSPSDITQAIERLVRDEEVVELEYVLPEMSYRTKSLYFPKGTKLTRAM